MALTPLDVDNIHFRRGFMGYDRVEVERFLAQVSRALEEQLGEASQLRQRITNLELDLQRYRDNEELLKSSMLLAQRTSDELIAAAQSRAQSITQEASLEAQQIRQGLATLRSEREQFEYAFHGLLSGFLRRLESGNTALLAPPAVPTAALPPAAIPAEAADAQPELIAYPVPANQPLPVVTSASYGTPNKAGPVEVAPVTGPVNPDEDAALFEQALSGVRPAST